MKKFRILDSEGTEEAIYTDSFYGEVLVSASEMLVHN